MRSTPVQVLFLFMSGSSWRDSNAVKSLRTMFTKDTRLNVTSVDGRIEVPTQIKKFKFDLILVSSSFLSARYSPSLFRVIREKFDFVASSDCRKVAKPQDDYDCSGILDTWLDEWNIDLIYTVCHKNWDTLYPVCSQQKILRHGYTSCITSSQIVPLSSK